MFAVKSGSAESLSAETNSVVCYKAVKFLWVKEFADRLLRGEEAKDVLLLTAKETVEKKEGFSYKRGDTFLQLEKPRTKTVIVSRPYGNISQAAIPLNSVELKPRHLWSCEDVCEYAVKTACMSRSTYYVELLAEKERGVVREKDFDEGTFVSYARKTLFIELLDALDNYFSTSSEFDREKVFVWLDMFCCNQPELTKTELPTETKILNAALIKKGIHVAISQFKHRVIHFDTWDSPSALTRAWCAWELLGVALSKKKLGIALSPKQEDRFLRALCGDAKQSAQIVESLTSIDVVNSECFNWRDKDMILQEIENESSFAEVNETIIGVLRKLHIAIARKEVASSVKKGAEETVQHVGLLHSLGLLLVSQSQFEEAKPVLKKSLELSEIVYGLDDKQTNAAMHDYALLLGDLGSWEDAKEMLLKVVEFDKRSKMEDLRSSAIHMVALAAAYDTLGELQASVEALREVVAQLQEQNMPELLATAQTNLAMSLFSQGLHEEAEKYCLEAKEIREDFFGGSHLSVANSLNNLAIIAKAKGKFDDAIEYQQKALSIHAKVHGSRHESVALDLGNIGSFYFEKMEYSTAVDFQRRALDAYLQVFDRNHPQIADAKSNLAISMIELGVYKEACVLLEDSLRIRRESTGERNARYASLLVSLGTGLKLCGESGRAEAVLRQAVILLKQLHGKNHESVAAAMNHLAEVLKEIKRYSEAASFSRNALEIWVAVHGEDHPQSAIILNSLAESLAAQGKNEEAKTEAKEAVRVLTKVLGKDHQVVLSLIEQYGL